MKLIVRGEEIPFKTIDTSRLRDVAELQQQTGMKLAAIRTECAENETVNTAVAIFLGRRAADLPTSWDDVQDYSFQDVRIVLEPGDAPRTPSEDDDEPDPQSPSGASAPDADEHGEDSPPETE